MLVSSSHRRPLTLMSEQAGYLVGPRGHTITDKPMKLSHIGASILFTGIFLLSGFYQWTPNVESLIAEEAVVKAIKPHGFASTVAEFSTSHEVQVTCISSRNSSVWHCPIKELRQLMQQGASLKIWHDKTTVHRAEHNSKLILDSSPTLNHRMFSGGLAFLCSLPLWLAFGRRVGLINPPMKQEVFVPTPSPKCPQPNDAVAKALDTE